MAFQGSGGDANGRSQSTPVYTDSGPWNGVAINLAGDTSFSPALRGIWVGVGGTIVVDMAGGTGVALDFPNVPAGQFWVSHVTKVYSSANGTTASSLRGVW